MLSSTFFDGAKALYRSVASRQYGSNHYAPEVKNWDVWTQTMLCHASRPNLGFYQDFLTSMDILSFLVQTNPYSLRDRSNNSNSNLRDKRPESRDLIKMKVSKQEKKKSLPAYHLTQVVQYWEKINIHFVCMRKNNCGQYSLTTRRNLGPNSP